MSPWFQNASCDPWGPVSTPCSLGNEVQYSIKVSTVQDVLAGLAFARENQVRVVIKNTGHEYIDRFFGHGKLAIGRAN